MTLKTLIHPWAGPQSLESLSDVVSTLEADGKGIPVLLRQYLKLGGKIVGFNVDEDFSDSIDSLLVVELCKMSRSGHGSQVSLMISQDGDRLRRGR